jgi:hypothetical protein
MAAFNIVRFRVKPGQAENFIAAHRAMKHPFKGFGGGWLVRTGEQTFCLVGQWRTFQNIVNARPEMIGLLDQMRGMLEDLGGGLGVTDPVSGEAIVKIGANKPAKRRVAAARKAKPAKKRPAPARKRAPAVKKRGR